MKADYDFERIWVLIQIAEKAQAHPSLKNITAAAAAELDAIANPPVEEEEVIEEEQPEEDEGNNPPLGDAPDGRRV